MLMHPNTTEAYDLFHNGTLALAEVERNGIRIDMDFLNEQRRRLTKKIKMTEKDFKISAFYKEWQRSTRTPVNINSDVQLARYLYKHKQIEPSKTTKSGKGSTDDETLKALKIPELDKLLRIRKLKKIRDTYLESFAREEVNGLLHPNFLLNFVRTFRGSSANPNFQNVPKREQEAMLITRKCLFPRVGHRLMELDFGSLEVRIAAAYHKDPTMLKYLREGHDMHGDIAKQIFFLDKFDKSIPSHDKLRKAAKNGFVFAEFYGDWYKKCAANLACTWGQLPKGKWKSGQGILFEDGHSLADHLKQNGIGSLSAFEDHLEKIEEHFWNKRFPVYRDWKETHWKKYQQTGYIDFYTGFRCSGLMSKNDVINYPVQGAAFHCLLWALIRINFLLKQYKMKSRIIGQIHDAIVFDVHPDEVEDVIRISKKEMVELLPKHYSWINTPLTVEADLGPVDGSWASLKSYKIS
jgi:DNA polymerase-1